MNWDMAGLARDSLCAAVFHLGSRLLRRLASTERTPLFASNSMRWPFDENGVRESERVTQCCFGAVVFGVLSHV
jgi:hypothetical protein